MTVLMLNLVYFLPIWFQTVKGVSPVRSGIDLLPLVISLTVSAILAGVGTQVSGYYTPFLMIGSCIAAIGAGLLTVLHVDTTQAQWIGFQIVYGFGLGACFQAPNLAAQTVLPRDEVSVGISLMLFSQTLFSTIFVSIGQNVLDQQLATRISGISGNSITPDQIESGGIIGLFKIIPQIYRSAVLQAYNDSLRVVFIIALVVACLSILGSLGMEWRSVKDGEDGPKEITQSPAQDEAV